MFASGILANPVAIESEEGKRGSVLLGNLMQKASKSMEVAMDAASEVARRNLDAMKTSAEEKWGFTVGRGESVDSEATTVMIVGDDDDDLPFELGAWVTVHSRTPQDGPMLNGCRGRIVRHDAVRDLFFVEFRDVDHCFMIKPQHLQWAPAPDLVSDNESEDMHIPEERSSPTRFNITDEVEIAGRTPADGPLVNGLCGIVVDFDEVRDLYTVEVCGTPSIRVLVKAQHLRSPTKTVEPESIPTPTETLKKTAEAWMPTLTAAFAGFTSSQDSEAAQSTSPPQVGKVQPLRKMAAALEVACEQRDEGGVAQKPLVSPSMFGLFSSRGPTVPATVEEEEEDLSPESPDSPTGGLGFAFTRARDPFTPSLDENEKKLYEEAWEQAQQEEAAEAAETTTPTSSVDPSTTEELVFGA